MEDLYLKILERLSKSGINQETDISDLFKDYCLNQPPKEIERTDEGPVEPSDLEYNLELASHPRSEKICEFLNTMAKSEHLTYTNNPITHSGNFDWAATPISITAKVTKGGLDYYYNRELQQSTLKINEANHKLIASNLKLNDAIETNLKTQRKLTRVTVFVAALAAIFSFFNLIKSEPKMSELNKNIRALSKETEGIKVQLKSLQNHPKSLPDSSHKH